MVLLRPRRVPTRAPAADAEIHRLSASIRTHGLLQPLVVRPIGRTTLLVSRFVGVGGVPEPTHSARARISARVAAIQANGINGLGRDAVGANVSAHTSATRQDLVAFLSERFDNQSANGYTAIANALVAWTARQMPPLDGVTCLAITGEEDRYAPPDGVRRFVELLPPGTRVEVMRDCGHLPFLEQPAQFAGIVERFLKER